MTEKYHVSGRITFRAKRPGDRAKLEARANAIMMDLCLYASGKYSDFDFSSLPASVHQPLIDRLR